MGYFCLWVLFVFFFVCFILIAGFSIYSAAGGSKAVQLSGAKKLVVIITERLLYIGGIQGNHMV